MFLLQCVYVSRFYAFPKMIIIETFISSFHTAIYMY
jgi:hypothetical protein